MDEFPTDGSSALDPVNNNDSGLDEQWWGDVSNPISEITDAAKGRNSGTGNGNGKAASFPGAGEQAARNGRKRESGASSKDRDARLKESGGMGAARSLESGSGNMNITNMMPAAGMVGQAVKVQGQLKKYGPMGAIIGLIISVGVMILGMQSMAPFGFVANALDQLNALRTSMNRRTKVMRKAQLSGENKSLTKVSLFGEKFKISGRMEKRLNKNGITVESEGGVKYLKFKDPDSGEILAVTATDADKNRLGGLVDADGSPMKTMTLDSAAGENRNFSVAQDKSTRTLKGHISGWFDKISSLFHGKISNSRNKYKDTKGDPDDPDMKNKVHEAAQSEGMKKSRGDSGIETAEQPEPREVDDLDNPILDDDGNPTGEYHKKTVQDPPQDTDYGNDALNEDVAKNGKTPDALTARAKKAAAVAGKVQGAICAAMKGIGSLAMVVGALHLANVINYTTQFLEAVDDVKAGEGTAALTENMSQISTPGDTKDIDDNVIRSGTSGMSSLAWGSFFDGPMIGADDEVAKQYNQDGAFSNATEALLNDHAATSGAASFVATIGGALGSAEGMVRTFQACAVMSMGISLVSAGLDAVEIIGAFVPGPGWIVAGIIELGKAIAKAAVMAAATAIIGVVVRKIAGWVAKILVQNLLEDALGEEGAYALASGANAYMSRNLLMSSGIPGNEAQVLAQWRETQTVIAEEAEYDRATHSPFDITNKNTFLGSIAYSLMPIGFQAQNSTVGGVFSRVLSTTGTMMSSLTGTKIYADEVKIATGLNKDCPSLSAVGDGVVGDAFCNAYIVSDHDPNFSTMQTDPTQVLVEVCKRNAGNFEDDLCNKYVLKDDDGNPVTPLGPDDPETYDENPKVSDTGELAKWIVSCPMRDSQWGYWDQQIESFVVNTGSIALDTVINGGVGGIPVIGDIVGIIQDGADLANKRWSTGEACTDDEYRFYAQYSTDQRWMESEGMIDESSVVAFMEDYYTQNPLDNSTEGVIARYTGMSMEQVDYVLGLAEYVNFVANYNPDERVALYESAEPKYYYYEDNSETVQTPAIKAERIVYFDLRGRTYTV